MLLFLTIQLISSLLAKVNRNDLIGKFNKVLVDFFSFLQIFLCHGHRLSLKVENFISFKLEEFVMMGMMEICL